MPPIHETYRKAVKTLVYEDQDDDDGVALDAPVNDVLPLDGQTTAYVEAILSAGGAHVDVAVIIYDADGSPSIAAPGVQRATATIYSAAAAAQDYHAPLLAFDLGGAASYEVRSQDASSGTRTLRTWAV
jgi:hypothetical protein